MTPKEKAKELIRKYYTFGLNNPAKSFSYYECKQCALIAVDEIMQSIRYTDAKNDLGYVGYWQKVKQEIEKL